MGRKNIIIGKQQFTDDEQVIEEVDKIKHHHARPPSHDEMETIHQNFAREYRLVQATGEFDAGAVVPEIVLALLFCVNIN